MGTPAHRDDLLEQIRGLAIEDREFIETALLREAYDQRQGTEVAAELDEINRRAADALAHPERGFTHEASIAHAQAAVAAVRSRRP
jgi:hypothetical protein